MRKLFSKQYREAVSSLENAIEHMDPEKVEFVLAWSNLSVNGVINRYLEQSEDPFVLLSRDLSRVEEYCREALMDGNAYFNLRSQYILPINNFYTEIVFNAVSEV